MPRQSKGPYLEFKRYRDRESRWVIRDGQKTKGTGLGTGASDEQKRQALADYLKKIHDPSPKRGGDPNQALVADCLAYYLTNNSSVSRTTRHRKKTGARGAARRRTSEFTPGWSSSSALARLANSPARSRPSTPNNADRCRQPGAS